ncbi:hypothetical protein WMF38_57355 [Sorangium sp. So ce118]
MATHADDADIARWEQRRQPTAAEQARIDDRFRKEHAEEAQRIGALAERVILGPPADTQAASAWVAQTRSEIEMFRLAGSLRAYNGGADVLVVLDSLIQRLEVRVARDIAEAEAVKGAVSQ